MHGNRETIAMTSRLSVFVSALFASVVILVLTAALASAEPAVTVKQVDLKATPAADAKTVATLPASSNVDLVLRQGAWVQLKAGDNTGWAKLFDIRLPSAGGAASAKSSGNSLAQTLNLAAGNRDSSVTTGVRGLDGETLAKATPNPQEFTKMVSFAGTKEQAKTFAADGKLAERQVELLK